ncbi:MAG: gene transfer agent family protein [Hyphomicrobiaceae bacterium]
MANQRRGEIDAVLDGRRYRLCLTLGALAELESAFGDEDMLALARRFEAGRISARDACRIIGAGLRGAGADVQDEDVAQMQAEGGVGGFVDIVARLLGATFAGDERAGVSQRAERQNVDGSGHNGDSEKGAVAAPFPGTR